MEKKYYFRGLGLGIIVTALIMGTVLSHGGKREMTDAEVIARAKELGMTENTRLLEPDEADEGQDGAEPTVEEEAAKEPVKKDVAVAQPKEDSGEQSKADAKDKTKAEQQKTDAGEKKPETEKGKASEEAARDKKPAADTNEMTKQDEDTGQKAQTEASPDRQTASAVNVTIVSGDGSYTVAKKLEEAGVVSSAAAYDDYLCQNGYDKRLRTGTFQIPAGADDEQIAKIVTSQP